MIRKMLKTVKKGDIHWRDLQKKVLATCHPFATGPRFQHQLEYLLSKGFIERGARGVYRITESGIKYMRLFRLCFL